MTDPRETARLAAAINLLRPDFVTASVQSYLLTNHIHRPYPDLAVAAVACYVDPATQYPKRLEAAGPWWHAARAAAGGERTVPMPPRHLPGIDGREPPAEDVARRGAAACRDALGDAELAEAGRRERELTLLIRRVRELTPGLSAAQRDRLAKATYAVPDTDRQETAS